MRFFLNSAIACILMVLALPQASAQTPASGTFVATQSCPATRSIRGGASDAVQIAAGQSFVLVGKNKPDATFYLIEVPGAQPARRWVATSCGSFNDAAGGGIINPLPLPPIDMGGAGNGTSGNAGSSNDFNVLAVSWQPAFCEAHQDKPECGSLTPARFDATHFTLHGLWPQPRGKAYCNVAQSYVSADKNHNWAALPPVALSDQTRAALAEVMPGMASNLERHEWIVHGTCFKATTSQDAYFDRAVALIAQLNASAVRTLFAENIGQRLSAAQIKAAFDLSFGPGAGNRIKISCGGSNRAITEITIGLGGVIDDTPSLAQLIAAAPSTSSGCPDGYVDPVR